MHAQYVTDWRNGPGSTVVNGQLLCSNAIILRKKKKKSKIMIIMTYNTTLCVGNVHSK